MILRGKNMLGEFSAFWSKVLFDLAIGKCLFVSVYSKVLFLFRILSFVYRVSV